MNLLIEHTRLIDPSQNLDAEAALSVENGIVSAYRREDIPYDIVLDGRGLVCAPGLVDVHVHLRDPGFTYKEDVYTGCRAAAVGGVTSLVPMPNTNPVCDTPQVVSYLREKAKTASARLYPCAAISQGMNGQALTDFAALKQAGAVAVSDDGKPVPSGRLMRQALEKAAEVGLVVTSHCEELSIVDGGIINEGEVSRQLGVKGIHRSSEDIITAREIILAKTLGVPVHICHVSTTGSVDLVRQAKKEGVQVTCETGPHYFTLTEQELLRRDANWRMNPPLRTEADRQAIWEAVADGTIDVVATDHAPHAPEEKADFLKAPNGILGLETSLALTLMAFYQTGRLTLSEIIRKMSTRPAEIFHLPAGSLKIGAKADAVLFDPEEEYLFTESMLGSKSKNSPFLGKRLQGKVKYTILGGRIVYQDQ